MFSRFDYSGIVANVYGINDPPLWARTAPLFEEYAVTGFKLEYIPTNLKGITVAQQPNVINIGVIYDTLVYQDLNTYNTSGYTDQQVV